MKSAGKVQPVTELVRVCGNAFAVTRRDGGVEIRKLRAPRPALQAGQVARVVVFPWAAVRRGR